MNASPDLRAQMEAFPALHPAGGALRDSRIEGVLLSNADLDHTLGLLLLREGDPLTVHATPAVQESLNAGLRMEPALNSFNGLRWREPAEEFAPLLGRDGSETGLQYRMIPLAGGPPPYARADASHAAGHSAAYQLLDPATGRRALIAPDVAEPPPALRQALNDSDLVLFDGTFWSDDELRRVNPAARTATQMGHLPICDGSLALLSNLPAATRVYVHINNTNPILNPSSAERAAVIEAGVLVGEDGMEFQL